MMSEVSRDSRSGLIQAIVHLVNKNFGKLSQDFVKLGFLSEEVNLEQLFQHFKMFLLMQLNKESRRWILKA